jgi:hypothetical protein
MDAMPNAIERTKFEEWYGTMDDREKNEPHFFLIHNKKVVRTTFRQIWIFAQAKYVWKNTEWLSEFREAETPKGDILWADTITRGDTWREHNFRLNIEKEKERELKLQNFNKKFEELKLKKVSEKLQKNKPGDAGRGRAWARPGERDVSRGGHGRRFGWKRQFGQWTRGGDQEQRDRDGGHAAPARRDARQLHRSRGPQEAASERRPKSEVVWAQPARGSADGAEADRQARQTAAARSAKETRRRGRSPGSSPDTSSADEEEPKGDLLQD